MRSRRLAGIVVDRRHREGRCEAFVGVPRSPALVDLLEAVRTRLLDLAVPEEGILVMGRVTDASVVHISGLCKNHGSAAGMVHALAGIDLDVPAGEALAVTGPSGCGKSTLLTLLTLTPALFGARRTVVEVLRAERG